MTLAFGCEEVYELTSVQEGRGAPASFLLSQDANNTPAFRL